MNLPTQLFRSRTARAVAIATTLLATSSAPASAAGWKWTVTPYAWATNVGVDVAIDDRQVIDETIKVSELLADLDTIAQVRIEAQRGPQGLMLDLFNVTLSEEGSRVGLPDGSGEAVLDSTAGMTILDVGGFFDPRGDQQGIAFLYGARVINERSEIDARIERSGAEPQERSYEVNDTLVDALIGVRYRRQLSRRWGYQMQAEVSTGGTDRTWSIGSTISYSFGDGGRHAVLAGYRRMEVDFDSAESVAAEMTLSGALVGLRFSF